MPRHTLHYYAALANEVLQASASTHTLLNAQRLLQRFWDDHKQLGIPPNTNQCWHRASKLAQVEEFQNLQRLIYKPEPATEYQRCTIVGKQIFYGAGNLRVALDEIEACAGDVVGMIKVRQHEEGKTPIWVIGEYDSILNAGYSLLGATGNEAELLSLEQHDPELANYFHYVDSVFSRLFRKRVHDPREYLMAALISESCFRRGIGVAYPSVQTHRGMNVAISKPSYDSDFEVVAACVLQVQHAYGSGIYELEVVRDSCTFSDDGSIDWESDQIFPFTQSLQSGTVIPPEYCGWRVPVAA